MKLTSVVLAVVAAALSGACTVSTGGHTGMSMANAGSAAGGERSVAVLSDVPATLVLQPVGTTLATNWKRTGRGFETTITFPVAYTSQYGSMALVRADGAAYSNWGPAEMSYLRHSNVGSNDPACVGGKAWCATRGL